MNRERMVKQVLYDYIQFGLVECNADKLLTLVADDIAGIGMGEQGMVHSKAAIRNIVETTKKEEEAVYNVEFCKEITVFPTDTTANLYAEVIVKKTAFGQEETSSFLQSLSLVYRDGKWLVCGLHASPLYFTKETLEAYPLKIAEKVMDQIRDKTCRETFELINRSISGGILGTFIENDRYPIYYINKHMLQYLDMTMEEFMEAYGEDASRIVCPEDRERVLKIVKEGIRFGEDYEARFRIMKKGGERLWVLERSRRIIDKDGRPALLGVFIDISESMELQSKLEEQNTLLEEQSDELMAQTEELRIQTKELLAQRERLVGRERELKISEERFRIALEKTSNFIFDYDIVKRELFCSEIPQRKVEPIRRLSQLERYLMKEGKIIPEYRGVLEKAFLDIESGLPEVECTVKVLLNTGRTIWNKILMTGIKDETGKAARAIGVVEDVTLQMEKEISLTLKSERDSMTNLYNRAAGAAKIEERLHTKEGKRSGVLIMLDVDCFKNINDTYGHPFGDKVLIETAKVIVDNFRENDIICRFGGDEFCIFLNGITSRKAIENKMNLICGGVREIFTPEFGKPGVSCSIGVCLSEGRDMSFHQMYQEADRALYQTKENGRNGFTIYQDGDFQI